MDVFADPASPAFFSRYCARRIVSPPPERPDRFLDAIRHTVAAHAYDAILLCDEALLEALAPLVDGSERWRGLLLPAPADLRRATSAHQALEAARSVGVPIPRTAIPEAPGEVDAAARELGFPVVVRRVTSGGDDHGRLARTPGELRARYQSHGGRLLLQESIPGPAYLVGGLFRDGQALRLCAHRTVLTYPPGDGSAAKVVTERLDALIEQGCRVMQALRYTGLGAATFVRDRRDGQLKFLGITPRLWASIDVAEHAGVDLYGAYLRVVKALPVEPDLRYRQGVGFHVIGTEMLLIARRPARLLGFLADCLNPRVHSDLDWRDPGPVRARLARTAGRARRALWSTEVTVVRLVLELDDWTSPAGVRADVLVRPATRDDLAAYRQQRSTGHLPREFFADLTHGADQAWLAHLDGEVAGIQWAFAPGAAALMRLEPTEREFRLSFVLPRFRRQGVNLAMKVGVIHALRASGVRRIYSHVLADNVASLRSLERLGWRPVAVTEVRRRLGRRRTRFVPLPARDDPGAAWRAVERLTRPRQEPRE